MQRLERQAAVDAGGLHRDPAVLLDDDQARAAGLDLKAITRQRLMQPGPARLCVEGGEQRRSRVVFDPAQ